MLGRTAALIIGFWWFKWFYSQNPLGESCQHSVWLTQQCCCVPVLLHLWSWWVFSELIFWNQIIYCKANVTQMLFVFDVVLEYFWWLSKPGCALVAIMSLDSLVSVKTAMDLCWSIAGSLKWLPAIDELKVASFSASWDSDGFEGDLLGRGSLGNPVVNIFSSRVNGFEVPIKTGGFLAYALSGRGINTSRERVT